MNRKTTVLASSALLSLVFLAGWGASDILSVDRLVVRNSDGEMRVVLGTDQFGGGYLAIRDATGAEVFAVRNGKVVWVDPQQADPRTTSNPDTLVAQLLRIELMELDHLALAMVDDLRAEAESLERRAASNDLTAAGYVPRTFRDSRGKLQKRDPDKNKRNELTRQAIELRKEAKRKNGEAERLERQSEEQGQRIYCWNGSMDVVLETDRDLSAQLSRIQPGGFLTWTGVRLELDGTTVRYRVRRVEPADRPDGFTGP